MKKKIAIVHDWLVSYTGAEHVLEQMLNVYPEADLFCIVDFFDENQRKLIHNKNSDTSFIQKLPFARRSYRNYLLFMPLAVEQFDLSAYNLIISSSFAVAKGVLSGPDQLHLCMCYSPMRYVWDLQHQYLSESGLSQGLLSWPVRWMLHQVRLWDYRTANNVDEFIAISNFISRRIWKTYRRESIIIYPPVDTDYFSLEEEKEDFYLTVSRFVPYKKIGLIVDVFNRIPEKKLCIIGDGPDFQKIQKKAGKNITLLGFQPTYIVKDFLQKASAFVYAAEEDFGIAPGEAQACGTPVIAYKKGGVFEIVRDLDSDAPSGVFFENQDIASMESAIRLFEENKKAITPANCRANALRFSPDRFRLEFQDFVERKWAKFLA